MIDGGADADDLDGGAGTDVVAGGGGNDLLQSSAGGDMLDGGEGDDQLTGDDGPNVLLGGVGADRLAGFEGADRLDGQDGDDTLDGGAGADVLSAGAGRDTVSYDQALQGVRVSLNGVPDDGGPGEGENVAGDVEVLVGSQLDDTLVAGAGALELHGSAGNDRLVGSPQAELLDGGAGDDVLDGGAGGDVLAGGEGYDAASYADRARPVRVSLGRGANDGEARERDDVRDDVERVIGTRRGDALSAVPGLAVQLDGAGGNDTIVLPALGGGEGTPGSVASCGSGTDTVAAGARDEVGRDCDIVRLPGGSRGSACRARSRRVCGSASVACDWALIGCCACRSGAGLRRGCCVP